MVVHWCFLRLGVLGFGFWVLGDSEAEREERREEWR
jgi:hypothetical protein